MSARVNATENDPTVIVGLACRVPGASNPSKLWDHIAAQRDVQRKMPEDRFNVDNYYHPDGTRKGTTNARFGYFLEQDIAEFDNSFFGISGKEADAMDPQQRLLLEVVYEALENAGITLQDISGSQTSVFCGSFTNDYLSMTGKDLTANYPMYHATGTGNAILSNRISYFYNLHGTSITLDTACSSSLVCFHLGNQSLKNGEADISIVVGSALHFDSNIYITMTDLGMLSTDGRCRAFDASGSGYVRGEGICAAILKRQSAAETAGDNIRAIVRATGSNHDGRKNGITLPNSVAQEDLIRSTYEQAGLNPLHTQYFEAHGTGTAAGDPIETRAIGAVFSPGRSNPLYVGSVKTNIGHLEGASGLAGLIKTTLALENGQIPPNMHFNNPNPKIMFDDWKIAVPTKMTPWEVPEGIARRASINSFGYGGTNGHVVLEEYKKNVAPKTRSVMAIENGVHARPYLVPLTSHSAKAGELTEETLKKYLEQGDVNVADLCYSLATRRTLHGQRSFVVANDSASLAEQLTIARPAAKWTLANKSSPRLGFIFTGQGAQWFAMGRQLIEESPLFRQSLKRCDSILQALPDRPEWSILEELCKTKETTLLGETLYSQTICTALQLALLEVLKAWGVTPSAVVGHSSGEMAAAAAAGILTFENALIAAYYRGRYMSAPNENGKPGGMMAVGLTEAKALEELKPYKGRLCIAAVNSPSTMTISGDEDAILELKDSLTEKKVFVRQLIVKQAFHSHHMNALAGAYEDALKNCKTFTTQKPTCRMFSSVTSRLADYESMGPKYWATNMTNAVRFSDALTGILLDEEDEQNVDVLIELGPHPALKGPARQTTQSLKLDLPYIGSLTRGVPDFEGLLNLAGTLFSLGYPVDLIAANQNLSLGADGSLVKVDTGSKLNDLPTYTWDHRRYWTETRYLKEHRLRKYRHSLLGHIIPGSIAKNPKWRNYLRLKELPWLQEHVVDGKVVFPGAGYISMAIEAALRVDEVESAKMIFVKDIVIKNALLLPESDDGVEILLELKPVTLSAKSHSETWYEFACYSYDENSNCTKHCHGLISTEKGEPAPVPEPISGSINLGELLKKTNRSVTSGQFYNQLAGLGLEYGEKFRLLSGSVESGPGFALSDLKFDPSALPQERGDETVVHPTLLDAFFHVIFNAIESRLGRPLDEPYVPSFFRTLKISGQFFSWAQSTEAKSFQVASFTQLPSPRVAINDMIMQNASGQLMMEIGGLEVTSLGREMPEGSGPRTLFYQQRWQPCFDLLGNAKGKSLSDIVDIFAHQYPDSKILHITSDVEKSKHVLSALGGTKSERRRFHNMDVWSLNGAKLGEEFETLSNNTNNLVNIVEPQPDSYDLVIVSETGSINAVPFMKDTGCIIFDGQKGSVAADLSEVFSSPICTALQKKKTAAPLTGPISVVMPSGDVSLRALTIYNAFESAFGGRIITSTFPEIAEAGLSAVADDVVVLATLDEIIDNESMFSGVQALLGAIQKNVIWPLEGATFESERPDLAMIIGLVRTARSENDSSRNVTFDFGKNTAAETVASNIIRALDASLTEDELAERNGVVYIPRVEADDGRNSKLRNGPAREPRLEAFGERRPLKLTFGKVGLLDTLHFAEDEEIIDTELAADELEIEVKASAINFRDLAASLGIIDDYKLGDECAGIVLRVGSEVKDYNVGDRVVAWRPGQGAHRAICRNPATLCHKIDANMSFTDAAALPCILTTAYYSLLDTARLQRGETVLIHAAAGGVGQMAVQIAQRVGARVLVTVGSPAKRQLMKEVYGISEDCMFSSRDDTFAAGVMRATGGKGVDVVLNSLAGNLLKETWGCLNAFGRFIEIGKRDIHENTKLDMSPYRKNVMFASVDLITMFERNKSLGARVFSECCELVNKGEIKLPAILEVSYQDVIKGFRLLQMGKHAGKIVLCPSKDDMVPVMPTSFRNTMLFSSEKIYLLVGGLGGLGRTLAQWMVRKGATKLAFLSRSGADKPEAQATVDWLVERGIEATVYRGDVAKLADVRACVEGISNLGGIFQAAMVLQDVPLETMSYSQWKRCVEPKVLGAKNLHEASLGVDLDFFVCFSSVATVLGSKAQANYSAANAFLDAFMRHRREMGLAGTTMNVGAVSGVGVVSENAALAKIMERLGMDPINEEELLYQLEEAVKGDRNVKTTARGVDAHQIMTGVGLIKPDVYWAAKPLLKNLYSNHDFGGSGAAGKSQKNVMAMLREESDPEKRTEIVLDNFLDKIAQVLATPKESIIPSNPLSAYGLDSIVAVEFRKHFRKEIQVDIALFDILGAASITALVQKAAKMIVLTSAAKEAGPADAKAEKSKGADAESAEKSAETSAMASGEMTKTKTSAGTPIALSTFQSRLWFVHSFLEDKSFLNLPIVMKIKGRPDLAALRTTMYELVSRNPSMRTSYFEGDEFAQQEILEDFDVDVSFRDLSGEADPEQALEEFVKYNRKIEMNVEEGEVSSFSLAKLSEDDWAFICMIHHISIDRGSMKGMMSQFVSLYDATVQGKDLSTVPSPEFSYVDFSIWHNARLASDLMRPDLDWWKERLAGIPQASKLLPFAKCERPQRSDPRRLALKTNLNSKLFARMKRLAAQANGTPFHFILAAFRAFLFRYTQEKDLVLLMVDGNRPHTDAEDINGFFVNLVPIRVEDDCEGATFDQLFANCKQRALESLAHSGVPFDTVVDILGAKKTPSHMPVGQIAVNYQIHGPTPTYSTSDFQINSMVTDDIPTAADMQLEALETSDHALDLRIEYSTALYSEADMERFLDNFLTFLSGCIKDHRQPIEEVGMCGEIELKTLANEFWNTETRENQWEGKSVLDKISQMALEHPQNTAIKTSDGYSITYKQLIQDATSVASELLQAGVKPGDRIALLAFPGVDAIVGQIASLMTRSCYVALDTDFAQDRLSFMISDAGSRVLLVGPGAESLASDLTSKAVVAPKIIRITEAVGAANTSTQFSPRQAQDPFYMIYTSGSTGTPKGVLLTEENTHQMLATLNKDYCFTSKDRFLHQSSMSFDLSIVQIYSALTAGATCLIAAWETRKDPHGLASFMATEAVTTTYFTPTQFALLLDLNTEALKKCNNYRVAYFAGERLPVRVARSFYDLKTPATLYNTWSPSELIVQTSIAKIEYPADGEVSLPIGFPMDNCRHYILDTKGNPLPAGMVGELVVGGSQVGAGYLNRPEINAKSFVENPFASVEDRKRGWTRMFKTGDRGCFRTSDKQLEFHGRIAGDKQIKLRGFRVDLGEVEQRIFQESQSQLVDIAVIARTIEAGQEDLQLIAYVVPKKALSADEKQAFVSTIHRKIKPHLNDYMLPNAYNFLTKLPVTIGGKVDRRNLLSRDLELLYPTTATTAKPTTAANGASSSAGDLETSVMGLFRGILGDKYSDVNDNFFQRGGHSILLVRLQAKIKKQYKIAPTLPQMIKEPTAAAVCAFIRRNKGDGSGGKAGFENVISWNVETKLPNDGRYIPRYGAPRVDRDELSKFLITGGESFIGLHLLAEILTSKPNATVYLLGSMERIETSVVVSELAKYGLINDHSKKGVVLTEKDVLSRIKIVPGTLSQPSFGLSKSAFRILGQTVEAIYHLGGHVSLLKTYSFLKPVNVAPIFDLIRLAGTGDHLSEIHYLSTWSVAHLQSWSQSKRTRADYVTAEEDMSHFQPPTEDEFGYFKSRWVAENLLCHAASRGFPVTITRASAVTGSSHNGNLDPADEFTLRMILSMIESAKVPQIGQPKQPGFAVDVVPVDYLAQGFLALTSEKEALASSSGATNYNKPHIYHIGNHSPLKLADLPEIVATLRPDGKRGEVVSLDEWLTSMDKGNADEAAVRNTVLKEYLATGYVMFSLDNSKTAALLENLVPGLDEKCPAVDAAFLGQLWQRIKKAEAGAQA
ncbi:beta-ketoacyl synthase domain-containing protein [Colletotrichum cuscutae]|uniref:Beta-ketoacyl synthase domain-containing protein n=1 Tax=Colletotrichum cuscutae TaxID=1209917 RepID=A0AAI9TTZ3_9PEZI|nr:beta-ketoacyl synthase domain-containing protein [Colletotrichum cuscutae]